jgi:MFS-type transporter involved in bile tolerance (Atg22 family)
MIFLQTIVGRLAFSLHVSCVAAYCTEIAEGETEIIALQSAGRFVEVSSMVLTLFAIIIGSAVIGAGEDVVRTAAFAQTFVTVVSVPVTVYSFLRFESRPALNKTTGSVLTSGFASLFHTASMLYKQNRAVLQFLVGLSFSDGAAGSVFVLFPIYALMQGKMEPSQVAPFTGIGMIMCVPGVFLAKALGTKFGLKRQLGNIQLLNIGVTLFLVITVTGAGKALFIALGAFGYGLASGGFYPMQKGLYMKLIPAGQEVEYQGLYNFFGLLLSPVPLWWWNLCEENAIGGSNSMRIGMLILAIHFGLAFLLMSLFLDEDKALEKAKETMHLRARPKVMVGGAKVGADV